MDSPRTSEDAAITRSTGSVSSSFLFDTNVNTGDNSPDLQCFEAHGQALRRWGLISSLTGAVDSGESNLIGTSKPAWAELEPEDTATGSASKCQQSGVDSASARSADSQAGLSASAGQAASEPGPPERVAAWAGLSSSAIGAGSGVSAPENGPPGCALTLSNEQHIGAGEAPIQ